MTLVHLLFLALSGLPYGLLQPFDVTVGVALGARSAKTISPLAGGGCIDSGAGSASTTGIEVVVELGCWATASAMGVIATATSPSEATSGKVGTLTEEVKVLAGAGRLGGTVRNYHLLGI